VGAHLGSVRDLFIATSFDSFDEKNLHTTMLLTLKTRRQLPMKDASYSDALASPPAVRAAGQQVRCAGENSF
jgi:hypothetical protein